MIFNFWKPKPPVEFLSDMVARLDHKADDKKLGYLRKHMIAIRQAMEQDPLPVVRHDAPVTEFEEDASETMEWSLGYLSWRADIAEALHHEDNYIFDSECMSPAAEYFLQQTKEDAVIAFQVLFAANPVVAIKNLSPAILFRKTIIDALQSVAHDDNPHLYFACYDAINYWDDVADLTEMKNNIVSLTYEALANMLEKDPRALLFPKVAGSKASCELGDYFACLPDYKHRQYFIQDNYTKIDQKIRDLGAEPREMSPILKELLEIDNKLTNCFRLAADPAHPDLSEAVLDLGFSQSDNIRIYSSYRFEFDEEKKGVILTAKYVPDPFIPAYEFICLTNPLADAAAPDQDMGADSKYLWMLRKNDQILASAFTKAGVTAYLESQTQYIVGEFPNPQEWKHAFFTQANQPPAQAPLLK